MRPDLPGPEFNTSVLNDHELLRGGLADVVIENLAQARRWAPIVELFRRQPATDGSFAMSAREWTTVKVTEVWGLGDKHARHELNVALFLDEHLPEIWELVRGGARDRGRVVTIVDLLRHRLDTPAEWRCCGERVLAFLRKHLVRDEELGVEVVRCTVTQLRNKLDYEIRIMRPKDDFAAGDERTVEQLMSDLAFDLIIGRADGVPVPGYARPIINVTVSLETLAGVADDPGVLSGGTVIPPDLARAIAMKEGATWYRMLTDPAGEMVALSTRSYRPTPPIWRYVVAAQSTCSNRACDRPSTESELDHEVEWPVGATDIDNLQPLCKFHHKVKHARIERPDLDWEYELAG